MKLTKTIRNDIRRTLLVRAFAEQEKILEAAVNTLATTAVLNLWGGYLDAAQQLHKDVPQCLNTIQNIWVRSGKGQWLACPEYPVICPVSSEANVYSITLDAKNIEKNLRQELILAFEKREQFSENKRETANEIDAILASVTTFKRLYEIYPELKELAPQLEPAGMNAENVKTLTVNHTRLMHLLKLPSENFKEVA